MSEIVSFAVKKATELKSDDRFIYLDIQLALIGLNSNRSFISKETYDNAKSSLDFIPICAALNRKGTDFLEHEGEKLECIGVILPSEYNNYRYETIEDKDGNKDQYIFCSGIIFREYAGAESKVILKDMVKSTSLEIEVLQKTKKDGLFYFDKIKYQSLVIMGSSYIPGMKNCHLEVASDYKEKYSQDIEKIKYIFSKQEEFSVGDELGKSDSINIKNDKDSSAAGDWEDPGAKMLNSLLKASNHASLIKEAYLIIDENVDNDLSVNNVHYPHHIINDGNLVVHYRGIQSALSRARAQGITGSPISHLKKHYKQLGLNMDNFEKFNLTKEDYSYLFEDINNFKESEVDKVVFNKEEFAKNFNAVANEMWGNIVNASEIKAEDLKAFAKEILTEEFNSFAKIKVDEKNVEFIQEKETLQSTFESEKETIKAEFITKSEEFTTQLAEFTTQLEEKQNSIVSLGQELDGLKEQYSAKETEIETFKSEVETYKTENEILKTDIVNFAKEKKETQAEIILSKFAKKINEDERKDLFGKLEKFNTVEEFEKEVKAFVCDKYEAETKGKKDFASYSRMGIIAENETKPEGEHWTDYVKDYQEKN